MSIAGFRRRLFQNALDTQHPIRSLLRWPYWLMKCRAGKPVTVWFKTGDIRMSLVPRLHSFGTTSIFIKRDSYEPELLAIRPLVKPDSVALDIGGSFGIFTLFMAYYVGSEGRIHTFEPGRFSFDQLKANVALNPKLDNITLHNLAATDAPATLTLFHIGDSPVNFSIGASVESPDAEQVQASRVDTTVPAEHQPRISFIKIDVEGYEMAALEGARKIIELTHPVIMFEVAASALARQSKTPADIYAYLASYGYRFWTFENGGFRPVTGTPEGNIFASITDLEAIVV